MAKLTKECNFSLHNEFKVEVIDAKTGELKQTAQAFNVICNGAWTNMFNLYNSGSDHYSNYEAYYIGYGSGTGTPSVSDTDFFHYEGYVQTTDSAHGAYDQYDTRQEYLGIIKRTLCRVMTESQENGKTITEVGLMKSYSDRAPIYTHAMLQDMNGNPISIVKTDTDIIKIISTTYLHFNPTADVRLNSSMFPGVASDAGAKFMLNLLKFRFYLPYYGSNGYLGKPRLWTGSGGATVAFGNPTVDTTNRRITCTTHRFDTTRNVTGGAYALVFDAVQSGSYSSRFTEPWLFIMCGTPTIPAQNVVGEVVGTGDGTTTKFKTLLDFPRNAHVYINGTEVQSGVTVRNLPNNTGLSNYMQRRDDNNKDLPVEWWPDQGGYRSGIYYNFTHEIGITNIGNSSWPNLVNVIWISDDGENWTEIYRRTGNMTVYNFTGAQQYSKYYKFDLSSPPTSNYPVNMGFNSYDGYNIEFDTAPANGDIITIDYDSDYLPKDSDHVLDVTLSFTFNEYTPTP